MFETALSSDPLTVLHERRRTRRIQVLLLVEVELRGERHIGRITELSRAGARIEARATKATGEAIVIRRGDVELHGQIAWAYGAVAGLWFPTPMDECTFLQLRRRTAG